MAMNVANNGRSVQSAINVTPMIDVLLVLLIIFMAISPQKPVGLNAAVPQPAAHGQEDESAVILEVALDGSLKINTRAIATVDLQTRLGEIFARRSSRVLFLKADSELEFQKVAAVIDQARGAGIDRVAFVPRKA